MPARLPSVLHSASTQRGARGSCEFLSGGGRGRTFHSACALIHTSSAPKTPPQLGACSPGKSDTMSTPVQASPAEILHTAASNVLERGLALLQEQCLQSVAGESPALERCCR